jgi:hypothetical protein
MLFPPLELSILNYVERRENGCVETYQKILYIIWKKQKNGISAVSAVRLRVAHPAH